jgi:hypothetical protein
LSVKVPRTAAPLAIARARLRLSSRNTLRADSVARPCGFVGSIRRPEPRRAPGHPPMPQLPPTGFFPIW